MDKMSQLYQIATGSTPQSDLHSEFLKRNSKVNIEKAKAEMAFYKGSKKDPLDSFDSWLQNTQKYTDDLNRNEYWQATVEMFPGSEDQAKDYLRNYIDRSSKGDSYQQEITIRNMMPKLPDWAREELTPKFFALQTQNSAQNLTKAVTLYKKNLKERVERLTLDELDLDVPEEQHLQDFLKLESMNLLDMAKVVNGRLAVADVKGTVLPVFEVKDRTQVTKDLNGQPSINEMDIVYNTGPEIMKEYIKKNLNLSKEKVAIGNRIASKTASDLLESGDSPMEEWGNSFSILVDHTPESALGSGMKGLIKKNKNMSKKDIIGSVVKLSQMYPNMFNSNEQRGTDVSVSTTTN